MSSIDKLLNAIMDACDEHDPEGDSELTKAINKLIAEWGVQHLTSSP